MDRLNDRKRSLLQIIDLLRLEGDMTQSRLKERILLQGSTVSYLVNDLKKMGVIVATGETIQSARPGKPGSIIQLNNQMAQFLGLYVEGARIHSYVVGLDGSILDDQVVPLHDPDGLEDFLGSLIEALRGKFSAVRGVGIAMKGLVLKSDRILLGQRQGEAVKNRQIEGLLQRLRQRFDPMPIRLENDANCVALLHQNQKQRSDMDLVLYLLNGSPFGIGCSILKNGELIKGARGAAGQYYEKNSRFIQADGSSRDRLTAERFVSEMMQHVATTAYLLDPEEIVLAGSLFDPESGFDEAAIEAEIRSYQLPMEVHVKGRSDDFNPGMGAALIAANCFVLESISKVGAR